MIEGQGRTRYDKGMANLTKTHDQWMQQCLELARKAALEDEVPVGALIIHEGEVIAQAYNRREKDHSVLAHAELLVIAEAAEKLGRWRLSGCTLYSSLEPCVMCAGAIVQARIPTVVYGAEDKKGGGQTLFEILNHPQLNHRVEIISGVLAGECGEVLSQFFKAKRNDSQR